MFEAEFRNHVRKSLQSLSPIIEANIRSQLNQISELGPSERLQFEASPFDFSVTSIQTEADVLASGAVDDAITEEAIDQAENHEIDWQTCISEELVNWFSLSWCNANGPAHFSPAFIYFHGGPESPRFDLEKREWQTVSQVWD